MKIAPHPQGFWLFSQPATDTLVVSLWLILASSKLCLNDAKWKTDKLFSKCRFMSKVRKCLSTLGIACYKATDSWNTLKYSPLLFGLKSYSLFKPHSRLLLLYEGKLPLKWFLSLLLDTWVALGKGWTSVQLHVTAPSKLDPNLPESIDYAYVFHHLSEYSTCNSWSKSTCLITNFLAFR